MSEEIFSEIEEDLHKERLKRIWVTYGRYIIIGVISIIAIVGGWQVFSIWKTQKINEASDLFFEYMEISKNIEDQKYNSYSKLADLPKGYDLLIKFQKANSFYQNSDSSSAQNIWENIAFNKNIDKEYRDIAIILSIMDQKKSSKLFNSLEGLIALNDKLGLLAMEIKAGILLEDGKKKDAIVIFEDLLKSPLASKITIERVNAILNALGEF